MTPLKKKRNSISFGLKKTPYIIFVVRNDRQIEVAGWLGDRRCVPPWGDGGRGFET